MACPYLDYRAEAGDRSFDVERAYCTAAAEFVQPMRADVCNDRYDLDHGRHCEIYRDHAPGTGGDDADPGPGDDADADR